MGSPSIYCHVETPTVTMPFPKYFFAGWQIIAKQTTQTETACSSLLKLVGTALHVTAK
jgi:hypothetical protein